MDEVVPVLWPTRIPVAVAVPVPVAEPVNDVGADFALLLLALPVPPPYLLLFELEAVGVSLPLPVALLDDMPSERMCRNRKLLDSIGLVGGAQLERWSRSTFYLRFSA